MLPVGHSIGPYRILGLLGAGGMGSVYEAEHSAMATRHAVKILGDQYVHNDRVRARFRREAQLMFALGDHPHIVRATDLVDTAETMALVVDLVDGGDLAQALERRPGPLSWPQAWAILQPIVAAVAYAHQRQVVHRDLKPENVLLRRDGTWPGIPLVADFGIAKVVGAEGATRTQARMGTPCYGSPEQFSNAKEAGPEADVWALGMLAFRLVTGQLPIDPESQSALYELYHGHRTVPPLTGVPPQVAVAVAAALQIDPQRRPRDASVLAKLLQPAEPETPRVPVSPPPALPSAAPPPPAQPPPPPEARAASGRRAGIFVGVALVAAAVLYAGTRGGDTPPSETLPAAVDKAVTPPVETPKPPDGMVYLPPGRFEMGSNSGSPDERPVHTVEVRRGFFLDRSEVTVGAYRACVAAGRCTEPGSGKYCNWGVSGRDDHPINCIDWQQARNYCKYRDMDLPTEAQWEYAARSAGQQSGSYPWGDEQPTCDRAVMYEGGDGCGQDRTWPVCSKPLGHTMQGACDLAGNVLEWVLDAYDAAAYQQARPAETPVEALDGNANRVLRGGSWGLHASDLRAADRDLFAPVIRSFNVGFRCSRTL